MKSHPTPADQALEIASVLLHEQQPTVSVEEAEAFRALVQGHFETQPSSGATLRLANWLLAGRGVKGLFGKTSKVPPQLACTIAAFTTRVGRLESAQVSALYLAAYCSLQSSNGQTDRDGALAPSPELKRWFKIGPLPDKPTQST